MPLVGWLFPGHSADWSRMTGSPCRLLASAPLEGTEQRKTVNEMNHKDTSVWDAICDGPEEAVNMKLRSELMICIK